MVGKERKRRVAACSVTGCTYTCRADKRRCRTTHYEKEHQGVEVPSTANLRTAPPAGQQTLNLPRQGASAGQPQPQPQIQRTAAQPNPAHPNPGARSAGTGGGEEDVLVERVAKAVLDILKPELEALARQRDVERLIDLAMDDVGQGLGLQERDVVTDSDAYLRAFRAKSIHELAEQCGFIISEDVNGRRCAVCPAFAPPLRRRIRS
mmetsp:Transcript_29469/g.75657  ORF Transcript_29469/g.75657 Transcript_29469/m.75657 type:complete len:207 (-) Transcript_29469:182-802(-)